MKILIVSDTHRRNDNYIKVLERVAPVDMVIHCGDIEGSEYLIAKSAGCPVQMVVGNNDFFSDLPREISMFPGMPALYRLQRASHHGFLLYQLHWGWQMAKRHIIKRRFPKVAGLERDMAFIPSMPQQDIRKSIVFHPYIAVQGLGNLPAVIAQAIYPGLNPFQFHIPHFLFFQEMHIPPPWECSVTGILA